ncbi:MAG TPA: hypothetical protein VL359_14010, partial [bacterium]|nr:hypothetical protein [bacterium]
DKARDQVRDLARELTGLRALVEETARQFELNVKARIDELLHIMESPAEIPGAPLPAFGALEKMTRRIQRVRVKPHRGRAKDLKRLQDLVDDLSAPLLGNEP